MEHEFKGFGRVTLRANLMGFAEDPCVLLLHTASHSRDVWASVADALVKAGRRVVNLDLRGHGRSDWAPDGNYEFAAFVEDIRSVLAQLASRPVIVGAGLGGWIAAAAIGEDGAHLASGLVFVDVPFELSGGAYGIVAKLREGGTSPLESKWDVRFLDALDLPTAIKRVKAAAPKFDVPVLFVRGARSELTATDASERYAKLIENAEFAEISEAGHDAALERTDIFNATLLDFLERRVPRFLPDYRSGSDARTLRNALGCFATGITVVTAIGLDGQPVGLTANSFTSVSLDPPLLLVCLAKTSGSRAAIEQGQQFAVNVLHIGQQRISTTFAKPGEDRFSHTPWQRGPKDTPLIGGALANFECSMFALHNAGDHVILVGRVEYAKYEPRRDPLLYFNGKYRRLHFA